MRTEELDEILAAREAARVLQEQENNLTPTQTEEPEKVETPIQEETKVEELKVETEEGEEEEDEKDTFIEALKEIKPETPITEVPKVEVPEDIKKELDEYKSKLSLYESDPLVQAVIMGATDKDIKQIAKEIAASDVSELSTIQLIEKAVKDAFPDKEADELAEILDTEIANYEGLSPLAKKRHENDLREKFSSAGYSSPTLAKIQEAFKAKEASKGPDIDPQELTKKIVEQETTAIKQIGQKLIGKTLKGVTFDEAKLNEILGEYDVNKVAPYLNSEGNLDPLAFIQDKFERKYQSDMMEYEIEKRVKQRMKEFVVTGKATPSTTPSVSKLSEVEQKLKDRGFNEAQIKAMTRQSRTID